MNDSAIHGNDWPVRLDSIKVGDRHRKNMGDIKALAASIDAIGLINPITVDSDFNLIAGGRRLAALRLLGKDFVETRIIEGLDDAVARLVAERDENTCRKDFTPSELVAHAEALAALEAPRAAERMAATQAKPGEGAVGCAPGGTAVGEPRTRDKVAKALGVGHSTIGRAKSVVDAAEDDTDPAVQSVAQKAREDMDAGTISIKSAAELVKQAKSKRREPVGRGHTGSPESHAARIRGLAGEGYRGQQIADRLDLSVEYVRQLSRDFSITLPDAAIGKRRRIDPNRVVGEAINALEGVAMGLDLLGDSDLGDLDIREVDGWAISLSDSLRSVNRLAKQLKEMTRE